MGKKVKKDEKGPPDDVFDPLLVESRQAQTVVLMLNSPEEDVLAKACEAIYKFVDKSDENKLTLLNLGAIDSLLPLLQHEDRIVRRNACMSLGVMASQVDCRKAMRKRSESIPSMVNLLAPEEDTVVHEFAALCLVSLANDYSSKIAIYEQEGLEPLIRCLNSSDPDVQKNSIETIASMLQDYQTKSAVRELGGLESMLQLLDSEYAIIQKLALEALQRATEEAENRAALRELEGINKLINFIGHPEWGDLHVYAVMVLSNCLEDTETMEVIKENSGLAKLVAFITDTQPPEEEEGGKKGKGEKKGASRAGKKKKVPTATLR